MGEYSVKLLAKDGNDLGCYRVGMANSVCKRFMGLMGKPGLEIGSGLIFPRCSSIHMFWMRFPIDVIWYARGNGGLYDVCGVSHGVRPWRLAFGPRGTYGCIEVAAGTVPKGLTKIEVLKMKDEPERTATHRPDFRECVRGHISPTRFHGEPVHYGGAAAQMHG